ncbi:unnamed protein product [Ophioblennius macclurei]
MSEVLASSSAEAEDAQPPQKLFSRRSRKSACSNIFSGVNLHQLHKLFRSAGERDAEHRAKLVWRGMDDDVGGAGEEGEEEEEEEDEAEAEEEARLAQALVGLRVRARNKAGIRVEANKEHKWLKASGYLRFEEPSSGRSFEDQEADSASEEFLLRSEENVSEYQNPFKPSAWRLGVAKLEGARDSERYLHRILH